MKIGTWRGSKEGGRTLLFGQTVVVTVKVLMAMELTAIVDEIHTVEIVCGYKDQRYQS